MRNILSAGLAAGLAASAPALAQDAADAASYDASTVVASVNGTDITLGHVIVMRDRLPEQYQNMPDETLMQGIVEQLVDQTLLAAEVSADAGNDPLDVQLHLENERRGTLAARLVDERFGQPLEDAAVQAAYDASIASFVAAPEFNASHILVPTEQEATALKTQIDEGGDFAELARDNSKDGSAAEGGLLGWFGPGQMVPEFDAAVAAMEPGAVEGPVQTQFGWHVIKLNETRESAPPALEDVRAEIETKMRQDALQTELEALRAAAEIEMPEADLPPAAIRESELLSN